MSFQHHQRRLVLDEQVKYLDERSLHSLGLWLSRRWDRCQALKNEATEGLSEIPIDIGVLREEWKSQVATQTKPAPSKSLSYSVLSPSDSQACYHSERSQKAGQQAIENILALQELVSTYRHEENTLQAELLDDDMATQEIQEKLSETRRVRAETENRIKRLRSTLGIDGRLSLLHLTQDKFIQLRVNASSLRARIVQRSRERKFELERLQQSYRNAMNGMYSIYIVYCDNF